MCVCLCVAEIIRGSRVFENYCHVSYYHDDFLQISMRKSVGMNPKMLASSGTMKSGGGE